MDQCTANDWGLRSRRYRGIYGVALVLHGDVSAEIRWIKQAIWRREQEGYLTLADWYRTVLCARFFFEIISGREKPPARVLARNMLTLVGVTFTAQKRICALVKQVRQNPQFDQNGHHIGQMRNRSWACSLSCQEEARALATQHLAEAKRIVSQFGPSPMLAKIDAALGGILPDWQLAPSRRHDPQRTLCPRRARDGCDRRFRRNCNALCYDRFTSIPAGRNAQIAALFAIERPSAAQRR